ncbi:hypothetical protein PanWU01x14_002880 [Parasponia andersonii]|uniref:Uncharacterized protein n=1 Tax=Parasponia andersonii TaxID=3476 RepID=A0A2P5E5D5_PARAD|nr:hypothetical protein PanWU01x14_002880 [Parasponia andersonii]
MMIGYGCGFVVWIVCWTICDREKVQLVFHDFSKVRNMQLRFKDKEVKDGTWELVRNSISTTQFSLTVVRNSSS